MRLGPRGWQGPAEHLLGAARELEPDVEAEAGMAGTREGHLAQLFRDAGLRDIEERTLSISVAHQTFDEWWQPYTLGVGPAGKYAAGLDPARQEKLRELCRKRLPPAPFELTAQAWAARGLV